jgi:hypothetical protein
MILFGAPSGPRAHHQMHDGTSVWSTQILRSADPAHPQAVLVEQSPHSVIKPHFHQTTQFQVAVDGEGTLNNHDLRPVAVHYALRQTGYGPIVAGARGFAYLALRPARDPGPLWIPEDVAKLDRKGKRRQVTSGSHAVRGAAVSSSAVVDVLPLDETALGAWLVHAAPGQRVAAPGGAGDGRFDIVLAGQLATGEGLLERMAVAWLSADVASCEIAAGPAGLDALVLQFPVGSTGPAATAL